MMSLSLQPPLLATPTRIGEARAHRARPMPALVTQEDRLYKRRLGSGEPPESSVATCAPCTDGTHFRNALAGGRAGAVGGAYISDVVVS
jgi:hypothetical protein